MLYLLIACIGLVVIATLFFVFLNDSELAIFIGGMCCMSGALGLCFVALLSVQYVGAKYKADIINTRFGTNYTQKEVFYASDVIDQIRELDRKRIEVNGNIMKGE